MILNESYILSNGVPIPKLGLGTWFIDDNKAAQAVRDALEIGYRNIDTAQAYGNERGVGEGIRTSGLPREELFVSTKLAAEIKNYDEAASAIDESLATMGLEHVDLMLIHSPQPWNDFRGGDYAEGNREAWRALEDAHNAGKIRAIGVSNFQQHDLENILGSCTVAPHATSRSSMRATPRPSSSPTARARRSWWRPTRPSRTAPSWRTRTSGRSLRTTV
jgi:diketogulonate reductase-like aldo/keto reductase